MQAEILLTLKLQQKLFADPRRISLLKHIALSGSISQGAKDAGISYKSAWDAINEMNQLSEHILVERATGGKGGGGAVLTRYGQRLIQLYDLLAQIQQKAFDVLSDDDALPLNSLLAAISRFSLQTSARNQWFGTITARDHDDVQQHVDVLLADGKTRLKVAITAQSGARLGLDEGKGNHDHQRDQQGHGELVLEKGTEGAAPIAVVGAGSGFGLRLAEPGGGEQLVFGQSLPSGSVLCLRGVELVFQQPGAFTFQKREHQRPPSFLPKWMRGSRRTMSTSPKIRPMMPTQAYSSTMPCTMVLSWRCTQVTSRPPMPGMLYRLSM